MRSMLLLLALVATGPVLGAQTRPVPPQLQSQATPTATVFLAQLPGSGCPVAFTAKHLPGAGVVQTRADAPWHKLGYELDLGSDTSPGRAMTQARVILHGLAGAHVLPAGAAAQGSATEEFSLPAQAGSAAAFHSVVYAHRLTGVQSIELAELTYADGTQWHESADNPCRITPNGFYLVTAGN